MSVGGGEPAGVHRDVPLTPVHHERAPIRSLVRAHRARQTPPKPAVAASANTDQTAPPDTATATPARPVPTPPAGTPAAFPIGGRPDDSSDVIPQAPGVDANRLATAARQPGSPARAPRHPGTTRGKRRAAAPRGRSPVAARRRGGLRRLPHRMWRDSRQDTDLPMCSKPSWRPARAASGGTSGERGGPLTRSAFSRIWRATCEDAELPRRNDPSPPAPLPRVAPDRGRGERDNRAVRARAGLADDHAHDLRRALAQA